MEKARLTFLGTGTSQGVPVIGCKCAVCSSPDRRDKRFRASALVEYGGLDILIDAGPDFRSQMLASGTGRLDALLLTHNHKDHTGGLDDVRALNYTARKAVEIYCEPYVLETVRREYSYAFAEKKYPGAPEWHIHLIGESPFRIYDNRSGGELVWIHDKGYFFIQEDGSLKASDNAVTEAEAACGNGTGSENGRLFADIVPVRGLHDSMPVLGFRFGNIAYITDMSSIPEGEMAKLQGLKHLTLNTVGYKKHHSHFSLDEALDLADRIGAENTWLTHLSHTFPRYEEFCAELRRMCIERGIRSNVQPAYDGLTIE